ncbi:hypothetical protein ACLOJK_020881 [Asimina triloba]
MTAGASDVPLTNPLEAITQHEPDTESLATRSEFGVFAEVMRAFQQQPSHSQQQQPASAPREARCSPTPHGIYYRAHRAKARYIRTTGAFTPIASNFLGLAVGGDPC